MADQTLDQLPEQLLPQDGDFLYAVREGGDIKVKRGTLVSGLVRESRAVATGPGLSGGGNLSADRTVALDVPGLAENLSPVAAADFVLVHETAAGQPRKVRIDRLPVTTQSQQTFDRVAVAGQPTIIADGNTDTLNLAPGANIAITTSSVTDTVTIAATGVVPTALSVSAGPGLTGGGDLSANRSIALDIAGQSEDTAPTLANHYLVSLDTGTGTVRKLRASLLSGGTYVLPKATGSALGGVIAGSGLAVDANGVLTLNYTIQPATSVSLGGVKVGANIAVSGDGTISAGAPYSLPTASASVLGGVKVGTGLTIDGAGVLSAPPQGSAYVLPIATTTTLGGVRQGANVTIAGDGAISVAAPYSLPTASASVLGGIKLGAGLAIDGAGSVTVTGGSSYTLPPATASVLGGVKVGSGIIAAVDGTISVASSGGTPSDGVIRPTGVTRGTGQSAAVRTANTAAIQAAINAMQAQGSGKVALGGGTVEISGELTLAGGHADVRVLDGEGATLVQQASGVSIIRLNGCRHNTVMNLELEYAAIQTTGATFDYTITDPHAALRLRDALFNRFDNITIRNAWIGICQDSPDPTGASGGGSYSNQYNHIEINVAANTGWGFCSRRGTGSQINNMYITGNGTSAPCNGGVLMLSTGQTTFNQLNVEWIKCRRAIHLSSCNGTVINSVNFEGITPTANAAGFGVVVHTDSLATTTFNGGTMADTRFDQTANGVANGVLFSSFAQAHLEVRGMHISMVKKTGTVRTSLFGCDGNVTMDGAYGHFHNITLRRTGSTEHYNLDDLCWHALGKSDSTYQGPLRTFNNVVGGVSGGYCAWGGDEAVPVTAGTPANTLYLLKHGSWQRFVSPLTAVRTVTLARTIDDVFDAAYAIPRVPAGAVMKVSRTPSSTGAFALSIANHNGTVLTTLAGAGESALFVMDTANWTLVEKTKTT
jgi:hypothetical protein